MITTFIHSRVWFRFTPRVESSQNIQFPALSAFLPGILTLFITGQIDLRVMFSFLSRSYVSSLASSQSAVYRASPIGYDLRPPHQVVKMVSSGSKVSGTSAESGPLQGLRSGMFGQCAQSRTTVNGRASWIVMKWFVAKLSLIASPYRGECSKSSSTTNLDDPFTSASLLPMTTQR